MKVSTALTLTLGGAIALSQGLIYVVTSVFADPMAQFTAYTTVATLTSFAIVGVVVAHNKRKTTASSVAQVQA